MAESIDDMPMRVGQVKLIGNNRTRPYVIEDQLQDAYEASTVNGVYNGLVAGAQRLDGLGLFESVRFSMDASDDGDPTKTDVTVTLKEKNWYLIQTGATTSGAQANLDASQFSSLRYNLAGSLKNALGHGESLNVGYNSPIAGLESQEIMARLSLPTLWRSRASFSLDGMVDTVDLTKFSSLLEHRRGVTATARTHDGAHAMAAELALRDITPKKHSGVAHAYAASLPVVAEARPSLKSSLKYTYTNDRRNDPFVPVVGSFFKAAFEGAGALGDATFVKGSFELQHHIPLLMLMFGESFQAPVTLSLCASGGAIRPLGDSKRTHFSDRFNLGGPMTLRGFPFYGAGPRASTKEGGRRGGDSLGGDIRYTGFPFPFPAMATAGWRAYLFVNSGNLTTWNTPVKRYAQDTRASVGVAAAWNLMGVGRLEINYARVLRRSPLDLPLDRMLQFGFGVTFE